MFILLPRRFPLHNPGRAQLTIMALDVPDGTPDRGEGVVILSIILMVLITLATITRIMSKIIAHQNWWWDDLFAILSVVSSLVGTNVYSIPNNDQEN